jgi:hypothetical protein
VRVEVQRVRERLQVLERVAGAHQRECDVVAPALMHQDVRGPQQVVHAVLRRHDPQVRDQEPPPALELRRDRAHGREALATRTAAHHDHARGVHAAAADRDLAVGFVGRDHQVRAAELRPFERPQQAMRKRSRLRVAEARDVQLGAQVVVIEHVALAEQPEWKRDRPEGVGRIGGVNDVEPAPAQHHQREPRRLEPAVEKFPDIGEESAGGGRRGIAPDRDAVDLFVAGVVRISHRADRGHLEAAPLQGGELHPHATIEGQRQILREVENPTTRGHGTPRR